MIQAGHSNLCLTSDSLENRSKVKQGACDSSALTFEKIKNNNQVSFKVKNTNKCLDVDTYSTSNGTIIILWDCHFDTNQKFVEVTNADQSKTYTTVNSQKCLDIDIVTTAGAGANLIQWECWGGVNQKFKEVPVSNLVPQTTGNNQIMCTAEVRNCSDGSRMPRDANCTWREDKCPIGSSNSGQVMCAAEVRICADGSRMQRDSECKWLEDKCPVTNSNSSSNSNTSNYTVPNSVETIINDMKLPNSYPIAIIDNGKVVEKPDGGYPGRHSSIIMGRVAHGSEMNTVTWWSPKTGYEYVRNVAWPNLVPWVVILTGTNNKASNTRVEMRNIKAYYLSRKTGKWIQLSSPSAIDGFNCPPGKWDNCGGETDITTNSNTTSVKPTGTGSNFHGWSTTGGKIVDPFDMQIYFATVEARIVGSDADKAEYMLHTGSDFYPEGVGVDGLGGYNPGSGYSRSKALTKEWQAFNYATIDSSPEVRVPGSVATEQELINNPPPLN
jgi:hypothetical protein